MIIIHPAGVFLRFYENSGKIYSKVGFYDKIIEIMQRYECEVLHEEKGKI